jgi:spore photoproduct lyase
VFLERVRVKYGLYQQLDGSVLRLVKQVGDGSIIKRFDKTPPPEKPNDVVCPHFVELKWAYGCPFDCAWCYLKGTLRFLPGKTAPIIKDKNKIISHLTSFLDETNHGSSYPKEVLNTGELADSLMFENNGHSLSKMILPVFETQKKHRALFLSKSDYIQNILRMETSHKPIFSFTVNAIPVSKRWERKAPSPLRRLNAAKKLSETSYDVRLRIDPIMPIKNWRISYKSLIDKIFDKFTPERITVGTPRGLQSTINNCKDKSWAEYLSDRSNWGRKLDSETRFKIYSTLFNYLKENHNFKKVAMCKETIEMWNSLGMDYRKIRCNCT